MAVDRHPRQAALPLLLINIGSFGGGAYPCLTNCFTVRAVQKCFCVSVCDGCTGEESAASVHGAVGRGLIRCYGYCNFIVMTSV